MVELRGSGIELGIGGVNAIHLGRFQDDVRLDLDSAESGGRVGSEVRVAGSGGEDHHPPLFQVTHSAATDIWLSHLRHLDRGHRAGGYPDSFEGILQGQRVDHRGQHAHVVAGGTVEPQLACGHAAEDVASADDERDLHAHLVHPLHLPGDGLDDREIDAVIAGATKCLAAQLEQDAVVLWRTVSQFRVGHASLTL